MLYPGGTFGRLADRFPVRHEIPADGMADGPPPVAAAALPGANRICPAVLLKTGELPTRPNKFLAHGDGRGRGMANW